MTEELVKKRINDMNLEQTIIISNTMEGLFHYYSSKNIRHKVYHPLFISFKFPDAVRLFIKNIYLSESVIFFKKGFADAV